jgi:hypothetical protein
MPVVDVSTTLYWLFAALYAALLVIGLAQCFLGARAVRAGTRTNYFIALVVLSNVIVVPLGWLALRFVAGMNDRIVLGALTLLATLLAWRVSSLRETLIVEIYGALVGGVCGALVGLPFGVATATTWVVHVALWLAGGMLGWMFARRQPHFSAIVFFAAAGAAIASQSLLGFYELFSGRLLPESAFARTIQSFFPILYAVFSGLGAVEVLFWAVVLLLFVAGMRVQCAYHRRHMPQAPALCEWFASRADTGEPSAITVDRAELK